MKCENCGKEHDGSYKSGRFCCEKCARSYSTKNDNKNELKEAKCIDCGKIIYINKRASTKNCKCDDCLKKQNKKMLNYVFCPVCGEKHKKKEKCKNEFCNKHNISQFKSLIKYFGFDKTKLGTLEVEKEFYRVREILYDLYWNKQLSAKEIEEKYNYPIGSNLVGKIFNYLEIPHKESGYAVRENIILNKTKIPKNINQYKAEWHNTWDEKEVYLRSSFESDYANELDKQKIKYEVESLRIKYFNTNLNEYHCAIPDFYLPETNTIVEIKSNWTLDIQEMKDKVKAYKDLGYNFKLILEHKDKTELVL